MDFDISKENIQPLRGGRNPTQLGMALQAQTNRELQLELEKQKEEYETAIRNYDGDDPLDNYYHYISWVEQSYPKHGHEGNLVALLEHCLGKFENDSRYTDDRRFCKLWIKYIDLQQNPLELYHMMHARGLCRGCADLYRAWAYYHEASEDFQGANNVLEVGKRELAQPFEELETAYQNLLLAVGQYNLHGPDAARRGLMEKRQALTSLVTYRPGRVGSIRVASGAGAGVLPSGAPVSRPNAGIAVFEDQRGAFGGHDVGPQSIISVARKQEAPKENTLKPGPWTTVSARKRAAGHRNHLGFTVHEDGNDSPEVTNFHHTVPRECQEDFSQWKPSIRMPEPADPRMIPMYPKDRVYIDPNTEYSIEELRSHRYIQRSTNKVNLHTSMSFMNDSSEPMSILQQSLVGTPQNRNTDRPQSHENFTVFGGPASKQENTMMHQTQLTHGVLMESVHADKLNFVDPIVVLDSPEGGQSPVQNQNEWRSQEVASPAPINVNYWDSPQSVLPAVVPKAKIHVYEQSMREMPPHSVQPRGSAMKTPFKALSAEDLAETGSRGGMDVADTVQATDCAQPQSNALFTDDSSSSFEDLRGPCGAKPKLLPTQDLNSSCNTQMFNLNCMHVSTPDNKRQYGLGAAEAEHTKKQLFADPQGGAPDAKALSVIMEETKSYGSSSCAGSTKSTVSGGSQTKQTTMATIEEHNSYLAQNLMANAALRSSLLGDLMDFNTQEGSPMRPVPMQDSPIESPVRTIPKPAVVKPLDSAPANPFDSALIAELLEIVSFPGPHAEGYVQINLSPKLCVRKDPIVIGNDRYIIDKQLGKGTYGTVYKACDLRNGVNVALKAHKVANKWEYYICREIQARLATDELRSLFMDVHLGYFNDHISILVSEYMPYGSLLDLANLVKQKSGKTLREPLCIYFTLEMLNIVQTLHDIRIIHADVKPDNFLVRLNADGLVGLQLIDFGCSIDMTLFPPGTAFTQRITTENFVCCEMRDGRPWNYHTDLFCVAASAHVLIFDKYITVEKHGNIWSISSRYHRYLRTDLWNMVFSSLLNQERGVANTAPLCKLLREAVDSSNGFLADMRYLVNLLKNR